IIRVHISPSGMLSKVLNNYIRNLAHASMFSDTNDVHANKHITQPRTQGNKTVSMHPDHCNYPRGFCLNPRPRKRVCSQISQPPQIAPPVALENLFGDSLTSLEALGLRIPPSLPVRADEVIETAQCLLLAQGGHFAAESQCPLSGVKQRTSHFDCSRLLMILSWLALLANLRRDRYASMPRRIGQEPNLFHRW